MMGRTDQVGVGAARSPQHPLLLPKWDSQQYKWTAEVWDQFGHTGEFIDVDVNTDTSSLKLLARIKIGILERCDGHEDLFLQDINGYCVGAQNVLHYSPIVEIAKRVPIRTELGETTYASIDEMLLAWEYDAGQSDVTYYFTQSIYYNP